MNDEQREFLGTKLDRIANAIHCLVDAIEDFQIVPTETSNERLDKLIDNVDAVFGYAYPEKVGAKNATK